MPPFDLHTRTEHFADATRDILVKIPWTFPLYSDCQQLLKSSGSVGANYLEADGAVSRDDFFYRIRVCRKEAMESLYWLRLLQKHLPEYDVPMNALLEECDQLIRIFSAIEKKSKRRS